MVIVCIIFAVFCLILIFCNIRLKNEMRKVKKELERTRDMQYNRQLTVSFSDRTFAELVSEINRNLDYQKKLKLQSEYAQRSLKQSVSDIAHDLRTPLTVIKGNLQMLENESMLSERGKGYLHVCIEKSDFMKKMADDFFELSVLESDMSELPLSKVNLTGVLMQFIADNEAVIRNCSLVPEVIFPEKTVFISADEQLLMRMLNNLLSNIIKYAENEFSISLENFEDKVHLTFSNPVRAENIDIDHIFDRTYRSDKSRSGNGVGLGLYIVKILAQKQKAEVRAEVDNSTLKIIIIFNTINR